MDSSYEQEQNDKGLWCVVLYIAFLGLLIYIYMHPFMLNDEQKNFAEKVALFVTIIIGLITVGLITEFTIKIPEMSRVRKILDRWYLPLPIFITIFYYYGIIWLLMKLIGYIVLLIVLYVTAIIVVLSFIGTMGLIVAWGLWKIFSEIKNILSSN